MSAEQLAITLCVKTTIGLKLWPLPDSKAQRFVTDCESLRSDLTDNDALRDQLIKRLLAQHVLIPKSFGYLPTKNLCELLALLLVGKLKLLLTDLFAVDRRHRVIPPTGKVGTDAHQGKGDRNNPDQGVLERLGATNGFAKIEEHGRI